MLVVKLRCRRAARKYKLRCQVNTPSAGSIMRLQNSTAHHIRFNCTTAVHMCTFSPLSAAAPVLQSPQHALLMAASVPAVLLQGCTLAIALCADRPEYNDKFSVIVHMGPVRTHMPCKHTMVALITCTLLPVYIFAAADYAVPCVVKCVLGPTPAGCTFFGLLLRCMACACRCADAQMYMWCVPQVVFVEFFRAPFLRFAAINSLDQVSSRLYDLLMMSCPPASAHCCSSISAVPCT
jgi:hypothetical protein